jgi:hypothetical protein
MIEIVESPALISAGLKLQEKALLSRIRSDNIYSSMYFQA